MFQILYVVFIVSVLIFGSTYIGPITPRHVMAMVMFVICWHNNAIRLDKYYRIYIVFIIGYILAQIFSGYLTEMVRLLLGYYFVSFVAYQSTKLLIRNDGNANLLMITLFFVGLVDGLVTIGQMYRLPYAHEISILLGNSTLGDIYNVMNLRSQDNMIGYTIPGLLGPVPNGYFLSSVSLLCFYTKTAKILIYNLIFVTFFVYATFLVQERTALVACLFLSLFSLLKILSSKEEMSLFKKVLMLASLLFVLVFFVPGFYESLMQGDSRYSMGFSLSEERGDISANALYYLMEHPTGGINEFSTLYHYPHNLFINAFMYGGLLGGIALLILFFKQLYLLFKIAFVRVNMYNAQQFVFAMMFACYTINSLTHNLSIVSGEPTFWLFWGAVVGLRDIVESSNSN